MDDRSLEQVNSSLKEEVFNDAETYFEALIASIEHARSRISLEVYIYENSRIAQRLTTALQQAAQRGVYIRLLTDGAGIDRHFVEAANELKNQGIEVRVHHPFPWSLNLWPYAAMRAAGVRKLLALWQRINLRNHRKTTLIDGKHLFLGSINISDKHLHTAHGGEGWRDTAIKISDTSFEPVEEAFDAIWHHTKRRYRYQSARHAKHSPYLLNYTRTLRRYHDKTIIQRVHQAKTHILITNAYFAPEQKLLSALKAAAQRSVNVTIILPAQSDVVFMSWVSAYFYRTLLKSGVRIFEYEPAMLHAKTMIIDNWCTIGSSNLNHRSFRHDLEIDYILQSEKAKSTLLCHFEADLLVSTEQFESELAIRKGWRLILGSLIVRLIGRWL